MNSRGYILLVEDDLDISEAIKLILEEEGFKVECAFNGREAIDFLNKTDHIPSLILLDIMMPYVNGYKFREIQLLDEKIAGIPTILLSAAGQVADIENLHFIEQLKKPIDLETLVDVVRRNMVMNSNINLIQAEITGTEHPSP